jgi:hypothetical protein
VRHALAIEFDGHRKCAKASRIKPSDRHELG